MIATWSWRREIRWSACQSTRAHRAEGASQPPPLYSLSLSLILGAFASSPRTALAQDAAFDGYYYGFLPNDNAYDVDGSETLGARETVADRAGWTIGTFQLDGNYSVCEEPRDGVPSLVVESGNLTLAYTYDDATTWRSPDGIWSLYVKDTAKTVAGVSLGSKVRSGCLLLQSRFDPGDEWATCYQQTDFFVDGPGGDADFYTTNDIQLENGCYYRVILAYELEDTSSVYDYNRNVVELYTFYAESSQTSQTQAGGTSQRYELGTLEVTDNKGYLNGHPITDMNDPHYGWSLGTFSLSGYTSITEDPQLGQVFLKTPGDVVTLSFRLDQDIAALNGNEKLSISDDTDGYDGELQYPQSNFKKGMRFIRHKDYEGHWSEPVAYEDFLVADARKGAETRVRLFEEGDYEVVLDYEIVKSSFPINSYHNYRISFSFSIRNGKCAVYPMDAATGSELESGSIVEEGFYLDLANSHYLNVSVQRSDLVKNADNTVRLEEQSSEAAADGSAYTKVGIYTITATAKYSGAEPVTKTIYVGENPYLRALVKLGGTGYLDTLNGYLRDGWTVEEDGSLTAPSAS